MRKQSFSEYYWMCVAVVFMVLFIVSLGLYLSSNRAMNDLLTNNYVLPSSHSGAYMPISGDQAIIVLDMNDPNQANAAIQMQAYFRSINQKGGNQ